ncbi:hypothetical protein EWM64_g2344 [Hericium alpestre]|uniref:AB hydrolase-1 domain-containing protein n=1 Tax=Hericium alpestre TaxID=135208 RepID=A0A4Z0A4N0_9AGAM|nr:hypothetical protein EWM64_g2344 [Hericium alpestre]
MPLAPLDDQETYLYFEDTGALLGIYTTLVIVHGSGYNSGIFKPMFVHAAAHGLRLVTVNRREYPNSTPLPDHELAMMRGGDIEAGKIFLRRRSLEVGQFLKWFLQKETISPISTSAGGKDEGGLVLLGWSSGWVHIAPLLAYADELPDDIVNALTPYLKGLCSYGACYQSPPRSTISDSRTGQRTRFHFEDAPDLLMGFPRTGSSKDWYTAIPDDSLTLPEYCAWFINSVTSYYDHPGLQTRDFDGFAQTGIANPPTDKRRTHDRMSLLDQEAILCASAIERLERHLHKAPPEIFLFATEKIFDRANAAIWPKCKMYAVLCEETLWTCLLGGWQFEDMYQRKKERGEVDRELEVLAMPGCNHFPHWDKLELTCKLLSEFFGQPQEAFDIGVARL